MERISRQRRSEGAWQEIVERHGQSGLTVPEFYEREGDLPGFFGPMIIGEGPPSGFVDLGSLGSSSSRFEFQPAVATCNSDNLDRVPCPTLTRTLP
jgi:hypothetical protein